MEDYETEWRRKYRIELETPRFTLRPLQAGDEEWLTPIWADPDVNRYLWEPDLTPRQAARGAEAMVRLDSYRHHFGVWAIQEKTGGLIHGWVELCKLEPWWGPNDEIALSYVLARTSWGRGIATEASARLLRHAFDTDDYLECVMAVVIGGHTASKRVLEKLGMRYVQSATAVEGKDLEFFRIDAPGRSAEPPPSTPAG